MEKDDNMDVQKEHKEGELSIKSRLLDVQLCMIGLGNHMIEKDVLKLFKKSFTVPPETLLKGLSKQRGKLFAFFQFTDCYQRDKFLEIFTSEFMPQNPRMKIREVDKKINPNSFKAIKSDKQERVYEEKRREMRNATAEEIAEEMKVPLADRVTPYHHLTYAEQIEKKREQLNEVLASFLSTLESEIKQKREDDFPSWYNENLRATKKPCELSYIIECEE